jgi:hypothetical protein
MEAGGHEPGTRLPGRPGPSFEPPADPSWPSVHGLSLVARIMRGRELATAAAGLPPLDSDQVLDLQRTAGNRLTTGALARWTDGLDAAILSEVGAALGRFATPEQALAAPPADLLDHLLPAQAADPEAHAAICAALDALAPRVAVRVTCTAAPAPAALRVDVHGPAGGTAAGDTELAPGFVATIELPFAAAFGDAGRIGPESALTLRLTGPDGSEAGVALPVPFVAPRALALGTARFVALAELLTA